MIKASLVFLAAYLAVVLTEQPPAEKEGGSAAPPPPVIKTFVANFKHNRHDMVSWEDVYCDNENKRAKTVYTVGANKREETTYYLEKEGAHGLKIVYQGRFGNGAVGKQCTFERGTLTHPVKIDSLFIDFTKYKFKGMGKLHSFDVETWRNDLDYSAWFLRREGEKITLLEHILPGFFTTDVTTFTTNPPIDAAFHYSLDGCEEMKHYAIDGSA